jgi:hypothetical protein
MRWRRFKSSKRRRTRPFASATNSGILAGILDVPLLPELVATTAELPVEWAQILGAAN